MASSEAQVKKDLTAAITAAQNSEKLLRSTYARLGTMLARGGAPVELIYAYNQGVAVHRAQLLELIKVVNDVSTTPVTVPNDGPAWLPRFNVKASQNGVAKRADVTVIGGAPPIEAGAVLQPGPAAAALGLIPAGVVILGALLIAAWKPQILPWASSVEAQKTRQAEIWAKADLLSNLTDRAERMANDCAGPNAGVDSAIYLDCLSKVSAQLGALQKTIPPLNTQGPSTSGYGFFKTVGILAVLGGLAYGGLKFHRWWKERELNKKFAPSQQQRQLPAYATGYDYDVDTDEDEE